MADLSKVKVNGSTYTLKDAAGRELIAAANTAITNLQTSKQDVIDADHKLAAAYVSLAPKTGTKLTAAEVNSAIYELERAIETGGTGSVVNVVKKETAESGYFASYEVTQGGAKVGATINIPKDYLVKSAELKTVTEADVPYTGAKVGDKYIDFVINVKEGTGTEDHIYLPVNELVDAYQADESTIHMENNTFSVKAVPISLVTDLQAELNAKALDSDLDAEVAARIAADALKEDKANLGGFAYVSKGEGTVAGQTISGVKATGNLSGSANITLSQTATAAELTKVDYTPSGSITGDAIKGGSINVTLKDAAAASDVALSRGDYRPTGDVTVTLKNNVVSEITGVGSLPTKEADSWTANVPTAIDVTKFNGGSVASYSHTGFSGGSLGEATKAAFVNDAIVADIDKDDAECLVFFAAPTAQAVTAQGAFTAAVYGTDTFNGGSVASLADGFYTAGSAASFEEGAFSQGSLPTMGNKTVAVDAATFAGDPETGLKVTGATYMKQVVDAKEFTPEAATLGFAGTEMKNFQVTGATYDKAGVSAATVAITGAELAVGNIVVGSKTVEVAPKAE